MAPEVLVLDDDHALNRMLTLHLEERGYTVRPHTSGETAMVDLAARSQDAIVLDVRLGNEDGFQILQRIRDLGNEAPVIIITAYHDIASTVRAMRSGAFDYIAKPVDLDELDATLDRILQYQRGKDAAVEIKSGDELQPSHIIGQGRAMQAIFKVIGRVAGTGTPVLITGEPGTGKVLIARAIHDFGEGQGPFVSVSCSAMPPELLETELFGHEAGAFTGATYPKPGKVELASRGTLLIDEIGALPPSLQPKIVRVLQERRVDRVGGTRSIPVDAQVIAATNQSVHRLVESGQLREDLFLRLQVVHIHVPPLRERPEDVPALIEYILRRANRGRRQPVLRVSPRAMRELTAYLWPGNVRELENTLLGAVALSNTDTLQLDDLHLGERRRLPEPGEPGDELRSLSEVEGRHIERVLRSTAGHKGRACGLLGISRPTLDKKLDKFDLRALATSLRQQAHDKKA